jgi:hypothetical protein
MAAFGMIGSAVALDCGQPRGWSWIDYINQEDFDKAYKSQSGTVREVELRAALGRIDGMESIYRGRVVSVQDLGETTKTQWPMAIVIFDQVEVIKGQLPASAEPGKLVVLGYTWCDGALNCAYSHFWKAGEVAPFWTTKYPGGDVKGETPSGDLEVVFRGHVDAQMGVCTTGSWLDAYESAIIGASPAEVERLKAKYPIRICPDDYCYRH